MSLFSVRGNEINADTIADRILRNGNIQFDRELSEAYRAYREVWVRGEDQPTGQEILIAMGTSAQAAMTAAWLRVQMLSSIATAMGKTELVDMSKLIPPIELKFNEDGSLRV